MATVASRVEQLRLEPVQEEGSGLVAARKSLPVGGDKWEFSFGDSHKIKLPAIPKEKPPSPKHDSARELSRRRPASVSPRGDGLEFSFGTSQGMQMPDIRHLAKTDQMPRPTATQTDESSRPGSATAARPGSAASYRSQAVEVALPHEMGTASPRGRPASSSSSFGQAGGADEQPPPRWSPRFAKGTSWSRSGGTSPQALSTPSSPPPDPPALPPGFRMSHDMQGNVATRAMPPPPLPMEASVSGWGPSPHPQQHVGGPHLVGQPDYTQAYLYQQPTPAYLGAGAPVGRHKIWSEPDMWAEHTAPAHLGRPSGFGRDRSPDLMQVYGKRLAAACGIAVLLIAAAMLLAFIIEGG